MNAALTFAVFIVGAAVGAIGLALWNIALEESDREETFRDHSDFEEETFRDHSDFEEEE